jgi:hypothetical protein
MMRLEKKERQKKFRINDSGGKKMLKSGQERQTELGD